MKTGRIIVLNLIVLLVILGAGGLGYYFWYQGYYYAATDNAQVQATTVQIAAPAAGTLAQWRVKQDDTVDKDATLGEIKPYAAAGTAAAPASVPPTAATIPVTTPIAGTVIRSLPVTGQAVVPGTPLATVADLAHAYVVANLPETVIDNVKVGQTVDITLDAYPGTQFTGRVEQIGLATAATFSLLPQNNASSTFTKTTQLIPVKIALDSNLGKKLMVGMSAEVRVHVR